MILRKAEDRHPFACGGIRLFFKGEYKRVFPEFILKHFDCIKPALDAGIVVLLYEAGDTVLPLDSTESLKKALHPEPAEKVPHKHREPEASVEESSHKTKKGGEKSSKGRKRSKGSKRGVESKDA